MTVSRALSNSAKVQKDTREAVLKRAREMGYVKSTAALAMRGSAPKVVGLLLPNIVNEFYARFANEISLACDERALQLIIHLTNDDAETQEQALKRLRENRAEAVVMVPAPGSADIPVQTGETMRVIELIRHSDSVNQGASILVDDSTAIKDSVRYLSEKGHTGIAFIGGFERLSSGRARRKAFVDGIEEVGLRLVPDLVKTGAPSFEMGRTHALDLMRLGQANALICGGFEISNGALSALIETNLHRDPAFRFIGYGDPSFYSWINGGISTIQVPVQELVEAAIEHIELDEAQEGNQPIRFPAKLRVR